MAEVGRAAGCRAMQGVVFGAAPDFDLPSANDFLANCADPFVVE